MARLIERTFDPTKPVLVRRFFVAAGRHFEPGNPFPWQRMAVSLRRTRLLFEAGKLMHADSVDYPAIEPAIEQAVVPAVQGIEPAVEPAIEPTVEPEVQAALETIAGGPVEAIQDDLDTLNMKDLRAIATAEGAPYRVSRDEQRKAIREHRKGGMTA